MQQFELKAIGTRNYNGLTFGKTYITLEGIEPPMFHGGSNYVTIINDNNKKVPIHLDRFEIVGEL